MAPPKIVLVTGCSTGIGLSTAVLLASDKEKRFKVYATLRNLAKKDELHEKGKNFLGETLIVKAMDVCSEDSVHEVLRELLAIHHRVDVLINNAGLGMFGALETQTMAASRSVFETNFFGVLRLIKAVLPTMKSNKGGHIICVSSVGGINGVPFNGVYCASKFAVEGLMESLAPMLKKFNVKCSLIEPGPVATSFMSNLAEGDKPDRPPLDEETKQLFENCGKKMQAAFSTVVQTPEEIADEILRAVNEEKPHLRYQTNKNYATMTAAKLTDPTGDKPVELVYQNFFG
ncbi:retinol dehydrogenase 8-like [Acropora palmata]|uniref:retinol dehydrogenase 8-like n=1 Tax=Acropora palmata TaxID=6131 RepID=UPI003DA0C7E4